MASDVLQEYLIRLGYQVDTSSFRRFNNNMSETNKKLLKIGGAVTAVAVATTAAVTKFAYQMREMYFASELANSSVKNLKGMEYAGKQIGVSGDSMASSIHSMAQALRLNPGLTELLQSFGIKVSGRDTSDVMVDFVAALKSMPENIATQYAGMFGISPDDYHVMVTHLDELKSKQSEYNELAKRMNVDIDKSKDVTLAYTSELDKMGVMFDLLAQKAGVGLLPLFKSLSKETESLLENLSSDWWWKPLDWNKSLPIFNKDTSSSSSGAISDKDVVKFWMDKGYSGSAAVGLMEAMRGENSKFDPNQAENGGGSGYGLYQWGKHRQDTFKKVMGRDMIGSSAQDQLEFANWELNNTEVSAGEHLKSAGSSWNAASIATKEYLRPADLEGQAAQRAASAERYSANNPITQNNTYNITGSDANAIADKVSTKQDAVNAKIVRDTKGGPR